MRPHVVLKQDLQLDIDMAKQFLVLSEKGGDDFRNSIYEPNPGLKGVDIEDKAFEEYFKKEYKKRNLELGESISKLQEIWDEVEPGFLDMTEDLFHGAEFPEGKYIGYVSIIDCNPRFLEDKIFQIFYRTNTPTRTISHELMHFMFYDYSLKKFPELFDEEDPDNGTYWSLAELFNNIILSLSNIKGLLGNQDDSPYPEHEEYYFDLVDMWNEKQDVDVFIPKAYSYLK